MEILDHLPEDQRVVIGMFYYEEMSVKDIAQTLGVSENTVKSRLSYGRKKIKEQVMDLEKRGTKLFRCCTFVFFLYLLGKAPTKYLQNQWCRKLCRILCNLIPGGIRASAFQVGVAGNSWGNNSRNPNNRLSGGAESSGQTGRSSTGPTGYDGSTGRPPGIGSPGPGMPGQIQTDGHPMRHIQQPRPHQRRRTHNRNCCETCRLRETAAVILAGSSGAGGITYGVVDIDKLPFVHQQEEETQEKETAETRKNDGS